MTKHLKDIDKINHPYKVDDEYFDQLTQNIQEQVGHRSYEPSKSLKWSWTLIPALSVVLTFFIWLDHAKKQPTNSEELISQVSTEDIINYLEYSDISEQELLSLTSEKSLEDFADINHIDLHEEDLEELMDNFDLNDLEI